MAALNNWAECKIHYGPTANAPISPVNAIAVGDPVTVANQPARAVAVWDIEIAHPVVAVQLLMSPAEEVVLVHTAASLVPNPRPATKPDMPKPLAGTVTDAAGDCVPD